MNQNGNRYPIAAVRERVRQHTGPVLDFVLGRHREAPPPELAELLSNHDPSLLVTPCGSEQAQAFAHAAAAMMQKMYGVTVSSKAVMPVPGGRTAMSFLASTLVRRNDSVVIFDPAYPAFGRVAHQLGARVHMVHLDPDRGLAPDLSMVPEADAEPIRFAALNYPNNPTGAVIDSGHLKDLFNRIQTETIVFNDATYGPLTFSTEPWSLLAHSGIAGARHRLLELHSLAKFFSLGPLSVSFLVGDEGIIEELKEYSEFAWSDQSRLHLQVALYCLQDGAHLATLRDTFRARMQRLTDTLTTIGFDPFPAESGMYVVCRVPATIGDRPVSGAGEAAGVLLEDHAVAVVPWEVEPHEYLRFSGQYSEDDLQNLAELGRSGKLILT